jgi:hypothetical protein
VHLSSDYIHPYKDAGGRAARCRVQIYLPDDVLDARVVVCSELSNNPDGSVIRANKLPTPLVWIEHRPEGMGGEPETFELVDFSSYEVEERAPYLGETRAWIGDATWKRLDRATVEGLIGQKA